MVAGKCHMDMGEVVPPALVEDHDRSLADAHNLGRRWHGASSGRIRYAVAPRFALSCTRGMLSGCAELARSAGWLLHSHSNENRDEVALIRKLTGLHPIHYLHEVGLTGEDVVLAHGVHLEPEEIQLLATTRTSVCHCPGANLKLASGIADVPRLRMAGVTVALGADGPPCNNRLSMFQEMSLAATLHGLRNGAGALSALDVLAMATREGARALGLDHLTGTLEEGKAADVTVIGLEGMGPATRRGTPVARGARGHGERRPPRRRGRPRGGRGPPPADGAGGDGAGARPERVAGDRRPHAGGTPTMRRTPFPRTILAQVGDEPS